MGVRVGLEGEKDFRNSLRDINHAFKVLGSEMQLVASQFAKTDQSTAALTARNAVLSKEIDQQKDKITTLKAALENAASSFGENDRRTQAWQIQLNKAQAELNGMERELGDNEQALETMGAEMTDDAKDADKLGDEVEQSGKDAEDAGGRFEKLGGVLKAAGAAMAATIAAVGAATLKLGKEVVAAYGEYEQLVGGVETLFKNAAPTVQNYANEAYKTAGLSANQYMETVTSFSASLLQSLGGDTAKAAKYADQAIIDMSDNANKMGSDMSQIQSAYQGFAKQNYTMLDNLKLGYGGTKTEMERLLADAGKIAGVKFNISSYSDVIQAIHVMQESMGIAGTTAKEASETIQGSIGALKSSFQNLLVGLGNADADVSKLVGHVIGSFQTVVKNITPVIENIVTALPQAINAVIVEVGKLLPSILSTVTDLFSQILSAILSLLPQLIPAAVEALMTIVGALIENLPLIINAAMQLVTALVQGVGTALPELIPAAIEAILTIVQGLLENMPMLLEAALQLILGLTQGLLDALPELIAKLPEIINSIVDFLLGSIPLIVDTGIALLVALVEALPDIIVQIVEVLPQIIASIVSALLGMKVKLAQAGLTLLVSLIELVPELLTRLKLKMPEIVTAMITGLKEGLGRMRDVGKALLDGIWEGISNMKSWLIGRIRSLGSAVTDAIKSVLGIHSPSAVFRDQIGANLALGLGEGFEAAMKDVSKEMQKAVPTDFDVAASVNGAAGFNGATPSISSPAGITVTLKIENFYNNTAQDVRALADEISQLISNGVKRKGAATA
jgi:phage-related protein